jgi:translocation and assembly module TamB
VKLGWKHWTAGCVTFAILGVLVVALVVGTGLADPWMLHEIVDRIELSTGTRVEIGGFHFEIWRLRAEIDNLTVHGLESASEPPLFHADRIEIAIRVISFFHRQIALNELIAERPQFVMRVDKSGKSNLPTPQTPSSGSPGIGALFDLRAQRVELHDGSATFNNRRSNLTLQGQNLNFTLQYVAAAASAEAYVGNFSWQRVQLEQQGDLPFRFDISAKFTLHRDAFDLDELVWKLPHSELDLQAQLPSFAKSDWNFRYRGRLSLEDVRTIYKSPLTPDAITDFSGQANYSSEAPAGNEWTATGNYRSHDVKLPYVWFHAAGLETSGDYTVARQKVTVPNFKVRGLGGAIDGRVEMDFRGLAFRTETHLRGDSLRQVFAALENPDFPVHTLHWDGSVDVDSVNTWNANFLHFRSTGKSTWTATHELLPGTIPVTATVDYDYSNDREEVDLGPSELSTPNTQLTFSGSLGAKDSALDAQLHATNLSEWGDFINILRGADVAPVAVAGQVDWDGRVLGPLSGPTFVGHLHATEAHYADYYWNNIDGTFEYSPDDMRLTKTTVQRGQMSALIDLSLKLDGAWSFLPTSPWTLEAHIDRAPSEDVQEMFETKYPIKGFLSGDVRGSGTREAPVLDANLVLDDFDTKGVHFDRLSGQLHWTGDEIRLTGADLRQAAGRVTGDFLYRPQDQTTEFNLAGSDISLSGIQALQTASLPIAGQLAFNLKGSGPLLKPTAQGDLKLASLKIGTEVQGDFTGKVTSDGNSAQVSLDSALARGKLDGQLTLGFSGDAPISGQVSVEQFDIDPFIASDLHLKQLTGHSSVDGTFTITGALRKPDSIAMEANITRASLDYDLVQLQNDGPVKLTYSKNEVRVEQLHLHGTDTDMQLSGSARFDRDRPMNLTLSGSVNLRLLKGVMPALAEQGRADVNVSIQGTIAQPQIVGRATVHDASANYADFPVGVSAMNGDFVFDSTRLLFQNVTAQAGGGNLTLNGSVTYGEGSLRYAITAVAPTIRVRYPAGMSWLMGGTLQLSGTTDAAVVSGNIQVQRMLFAEGVDVASMFATSSETSSGSSASSPFLRNLTFDIAAQTTPGAQIQWTGAQVDMDGDVRVRGTWDRPVLLGHVHLLGGQMAFRGNDYTLTRGDINFSNPFRLDPILNVEATSTISEYQVTIDFTGPASHLALNYRSDPPLPDSDIIALLALGSTGESSALRSQSTASQNYGATALLSEAISSGLGGRIEHLFGISQFRVDPFIAGTTTESNATARVTIVQRLAHGITITYSTNAASNQQQLIQVEYAVKRDLSVEFLRDINGTNGFDIKWVKHLK